MIRRRIRQKRMENPDSRYRFLDVLELEDRKLTYETMENIEFPSTNKDKYHEVKTEETNRLDKIAYRYYRNPTLWWVIAYANDILDPFQLERGELLRIPAKSSVYGKNGVVN